MPTHGGAACLAEQLVRADALAAPRVGKPRAAPRSHPAVMLEVDELNTVGRRWADGRTAAAAIRENP